MRRAEIGPYFTSRSGAVPSQSGWVYEPSASRNAFGLMKAPIRPPYPNASLRFRLSSNMVYCPKPPRINVPGCCATAGAARSRAAIEQMVQLLLNMRTSSFKRVVKKNPTRSEEHTSELQSRPHHVCRLLLEKK